MNIQTFEFGSISQCLLVAAPSRKPHRRLIRQDSRRLRTRRAWLGTCQCSFGLRLSASLFLCFSFLGQSSNNVKFLRSNNILAFANWTTYLQTKSGLTPIRPVTPCRLKSGLTPIRPVKHFQPKSGLLPIRTPTPRSGGWPKSGMTPLCPHPTSFGSSPQVLLKSTPVLVVSAKTIQSSWNCFFYVSMFCRGVCRENKARTS